MKQQQQQQPKEFVRIYKGSGEIWYINSFLSNTMNLILWVGGFSVIPLTILSFYAQWNKTGSVFGGLVVISYIPWPVSRRFEDFFYEGSMNHAKSCSLNFEDDTCLLTGKDEPTIVAAHPHGCFSMGVRCLCVSPPYREAPNPPICVVSSLLYYQPFGYFTFNRVNAGGAPSSKASFKNLLKKRKNILLQPGGFEEATTSCPNAPDRVWTSKGGFVKYALQYGYTITPMYVFNEKNGYHNIQGAWKIRLWLSSFGLPALVFAGKWWAPWLPLTLWGENGFHVVHGTPIPCPKLKTPGQPTPDEVESYRQEYEESVLDLYRRHAPTFYKEGEFESELEIWPRDCPAYK